MIESPEELRANLRDVRDAVTAAAARAGRDPADVTLIGVTKTLPARVASWAVEAGLTDLGENYVQELAEKRAAAAGARWHFIGRLQSRTANRVADLADVVHSAVPGRALERLARRAAAQGRSIPVLLQVDESGVHEGVAPDETPNAVDELGGLEGVEPVGLMSLPPQPDDPEDSRPYFRRLRSLRDDLRKRVPELRELSMGMSLDYEIAVEEGATMCRVGTALFGPRPV